MNYEHIINLNMNYNDFISYVQNGNWREQVEVWWRLAECFSQMEDGGERRRIKSRRYFDWNDNVKEDSEYWQKRYASKDYNHQGKTEWRSNAKTKMTNYDDSEE